MIMSWLFDNTYEIFLTEVHHLLHRDVPRGTVRFLFEDNGDTTCQQLQQLSLLYLTWTAGRALAQHHLPPAWRPDL